MLYIEKEGFLPILETAQLAERFDLALASSKGMSVTACRLLVEELCGRRGLPLFTLHDFDVSGFSIAQTLVTSNRRYTFKHKINHIDLGLRLADSSRAWKTSRCRSSRTRARSRSACASTAQPRPRSISCLTGPDKVGRRVELNAMTSGQFVAFVERKLDRTRRRQGHPESGIAGQDLYGAQARSPGGQDARAELARLNAEPVDVPDDLAARVQAYLADNPAETWDGAVKAIMDGLR